MSKIPLSKTVDHFKEWLVIKNNKSSNTAALYGKILTYFSQSCNNKAVSSLTEDDFFFFKKHLVKTKKSDAYIATVISALITYLDFLRNELKITPVSEKEIRILRPRVSKKTSLDKALDSEEFLTLMDYASDIEDKALIAILYCTGFRINELLKLKVQDFHERSVHVNVERPTSSRPSADIVQKKILFVTVQSKSDRQRSIPISSDLRPILDQYLQYRSTLQKYSEFKNRRISNRLFPKHYVTYWRKIKTIGQKAGINVHPHMFRHSFGTELFSKGYDLHTIAELMGHKSLESTRIYTTVKDTRKIMAVEDHGNILEKTSR